MTGNQTRPLGRKRRNGLAAFRALELEVQAALAAGRTVLSIYEEKRNRLGMSYAQFARYTRPVRRGFEAQALTHRPLANPSATMRAVAERRTPLAVGTGPPRGRPEDAVPNLDMDGFATQALKKKDLF